MFSARVLSALLALTLILSFAGCGQKPEPDKDDSQPVSDVSDVSTTTTTTESVDDTTTDVDASGDTTTDAVSDTGTDTTGDATTTTTTTGTDTTGTTAKPTAGDTTGKVTDTTTEKPTTTTTTTEKPTSATEKTSRTKKTVTAKPTTTTTTAAEVEEKSIRILAVGNSFSKDAMHNHLYRVLESAGYTDITLGNLYIGGCSLNTHWNNANSGIGAYEFYYNTSGSWKTVNNATINRGIDFADWDIITVQQASPDSGRPDTYSNLSKLVDWIQSKKPKADIYFHMTWAYQQDSTHSSFPNYNKDQMTMYNAICSTAQSKVLGVSSIQGVIPCGTTIQNLRTSSLGDTLTADGYHLKDSYGDYAAALTWYCYLLGGKPEDISYRPSSIEDHFDEIAESVTNAIQTPYRITSCK